MPWFEITGFLVLGVVVGTYGSMVGVGGGFFMVPVLLFLGYPAPVAAGTSLVVVLVNALSSTASYLEQRRVDVRSGLIFAAAGIPGAVLGAYAVQHVPRHLFTILFALMLIAVAVRAFFTKDPPQSTASDATPASQGSGSTVRAFTDARGVEHRYRFNLLLGIAVAAGAGFLASMFGIGGGVVQVPAMVYLLHFPTHVAVATSQVVIAGTALFGSLSHAYYGDILVMPAVFLSIGAVFGAQVGARLAARMPAGALMRLFSLVVAFVALYLLFRG